MLDTVKINHVQHISFTQSRLTDAVSVILSELLSYEHPSNGGGSFCLFGTIPAVLPGRDPIPGLELAVEVGEVLEPHLPGNVQDTVAALPQLLRCHRQPPSVEVGREAAAGHLPKPAHKMAGTASAAFRHLGHRQRLGILCLDPVQDPLQPLGAGGVRRNRLRIHAQ